MVPVVLPFVVLVLRICIVQKPMYGTLIMDAITEADIYCDGCANCDDGDENINAMWEY